MGLYAGRVKACWMRDSSTWLQSMTALMSGTARKDGFSRQGRPVAVIGDHARPVLGHVLAEEFLHGQGQGLEHLALFHCGDPLKGIDVVRMHGKEAHELVHALVHVAIELGEGSQVLPDLDLLFGGLLEQALGHNEFDVLASDKDLLEAVLHPANAVGHERKARTVKNGFLYAGDKAEPQILADLADLAKKLRSRINS